MCHTCIHAILPCSGGKKPIWNIWFHKYLKITKLKTIIKLTIHSKNSKNKYIINMHPHYRPLKKPLAQYYNILVQLTKFPRVVLPLKSQLIKHETSPNGRQEFMNNIIQPPLVNSKAIIKVCAMNHARRPAVHTIYIQHRSGHHHQ